MVIQVSASLQALDLIQSVDIAHWLVHIGDKESQPDWSFAQLKLCVATSSGAGFRFFFLANLYKLHISMYVNLAQ